VRATDAYGCAVTLGVSLTVKGLSIGDLVYDDADFSGTRDIGELGVKDVIVQLWDPGADLAIGGSGPDADVQIGADRLTGALGTYAFDNLLPGFYYVRVIPPNNLPIPGGNPVDADNAIDNDNNSAQQPGGSGTVIYGPVIELATGGETTDEDADHDTDFTLDFGLFRGLNVGDPPTPNYVWEDSNDDGIKQAGEPGLDGVTVNLWSAGSDERIGGADDSLIESKVTANGGKHYFVNLPPGSYYLVLPAPPGSHPLSSSTTALLDNQVENDDNGHQISGCAIYSPVIELVAGTEFSGGGYNESTIDFGLLAVTPTLYVSATQDDSIQTYDSTHGNFTGTLRSPFGISHNQGDGNPFDVPYNLELGPDGNWYVAHFGDGNLTRITSAGVQTTSILNKTGVTLSELQNFAFGPDGNFYVVDHTGGRIVRFAGPLSTTPGVPLGGAPYTFIARTGIQDIAFGPDGNLIVVVQDVSTRDIRRYNATTGSLMNVIATDSQIASMISGGQPTPFVSGIDVSGGTLYGINRSDGEVFRINISSPAAPGAPQLIATLSSAGLGDVDTRDIEFDPHSGQLFIIGYNWVKPIIGGTYASGALLRIDPVGAPNGTVNLFEAPIPTPPGPNNEIWSGPRDLALGKPRSTLAQSMSIGSVVWNDANGNGIHDAGENGIPGVRAELWRDSDGNSANGAELRIGWTFTNSLGHFYFSGQTPGTYQIVLPVSNFADGQPLANSGFSSPITINLDNQIDGDDNGIQSGGSRTSVVSPLIVLSPGTEPVGDANIGVESKSGGDLDNITTAAYSTDANGDMTVDFGFVEPGVMSLGNLVFDDANGNRRFDNGEGIDDVVVQLYNWGATPGVNQPVASTVTANGGKYLFSTLWQGQYFVHLPAVQFQITGNIRGLFSLEGVQAGDDNVGEDSVDSLQPHVDGISTGRILLTRDSAPTNSTTETGFDATSDDSDDVNGDLTVDIGLFRPVALGNLVYLDNNSNGFADSGEGIDGVEVQLFISTQDPKTDIPLVTTTTADGGRYLFSFIRPGSYLVHIPKAMFKNNGPLYLRVSVDEGLAGDDDAGEDGRNDTIPENDGVTSLIISLFPGGCPTDLSGETGIGSTTDNDNDASVDLTVDFGFQTPVGVGNLVFIDSNSNGNADTNEGVDGVKVEIYMADQTPGLSEPLFTRITADGGKYGFDYLASGSYILFIPPSEFQLGEPLGQVVSMTGSQLDTSDDQLGEDGIDNSTPAINGIRSRIFALNVDNAPVDNGDERGFSKTDDNFDDNNFDLTMDFGFASATANVVGVGNLVFLDSNANGVYDDGEGADGVTVQLFAGTADPLTAQPMRSTTTADGGIYLFSALDAGQYKVHIPASQFTATAVLAGWASVPGQGIDNGIDDGQDENGSDADPALNGVTSSIITLAVDDEPENFDGESGLEAFMDDANDDNTDLTVDFGFYRSVSVGNLVFIDANYNGRAEAGEGVAGVEIKLFKSGDSPIFDNAEATTVTDANGHYHFANLTPGSYFLYVPYEMFLNGALLYQYASVFGSQQFDDDLGEDGLDESRPDINGISTAVFTLVANGCPAGTGENGLNGSSDDAADASTDLTRDLGFVARVQIGNLVFHDLNSDGVFDPNTELGLDGVPLQLWSNNASDTVPLATTTTAGGGLYSFNIAPGGYHIRIPATAFEANGPVANLIPPAPTANSAGVFIDDDLGQDGYSAGGAVRTDAFTVLPGLAPDENNGETGFLSFDDDSFDNDSNLTIDIGLAPKPIYVGNLVFSDMNTDGHFTAGTDAGISGVLLELYATGAFPGSDPPAATTYSGPDGSYLLRAPGAGSYFIFIPATQFAANGTLNGAMPVNGFGDDDGTDDGVNEHTLTASAPSSTGVSSIVFDLAYGTEPVDGLENGFLGASDDSFDADADLTIDLGFTGAGSQQDLGVGNVVFIDADNNGQYDSGEGKSGVWMLLYRGTDVPGQFTPYRSTHTDSAGRYLFTNLPADTYTVHVAADNFKPNFPLPGFPNQTGSGNGPLYGMISLSGNSTGDDNTGEDGVDATLPELVGISSIAFALDAGTQPVGAAEPGFDGAFDNAKDADYNLTIDFGFKAATAGAPLAQRERNTVTVAAGDSTQTSPESTTFASWQNDHPGAATDDADSDSAANLLEYAMGSNPDSGTSQPGFKLTTDAATGRVDAVVIRPTGGRSDVRYVLSAKADARSTTWTRLSLTPAFTQNNNGTETLRYTDVASADATLGLVRLETQLDADLDGTAEATATSTPQAWLRRPITERMTFAMPLLKDALFTGKVSSIDDNTLTLPVSITLPANVACYAEVHSTGERFEIDTIESTSTRIVLVGTAAPAAGQIITVRPHWSVSELFPVDLFTSGTSADDADRVMFFNSDTNNFRTAWLGSEGWTGDFAGTRSIAPGEGLLVHARSGIVTLTLTGAVRTNRFNQPLKAGAQLIGSGFPVDHSPLSLGLTTANGFTAGISADAAARLRLWEGDLTEGASTYRSLFHQQQVDGSAWIVEGDVTHLDQTRALLIQPGQAYFLLPRTALPLYQEP
jgi:protocatechuate 3,4-dioxygenase beta subunit